MSYEISFEMAIQLIEHYYEKAYVMNKQKGFSAKKTQAAFDLTTQANQLLQQLKEDGHDTKEIVERVKARIMEKHAYDKLEVFVDGAARYSNDVEEKNRSAYAFAVYGNKKNIYEEAKFIGGTIHLPKLKHEPADQPVLSHQATSTSMEYLSLIKGLEYLLTNKLNAKDIFIYTDAQSIVNQVNMVVATKSDHLIRMRDYAKELISEFNNLTILHIYRENNKYVDALVNKVLDEYDQKAVKQSVK